MKILSKYFLALVTVFFLTACGLSPVDEPEVSEPVVQTTEIDEELILSDEQGFLMHGEEKFMDQTIAEWLGGSDYNAGIWFQRDEGDKVVVYFGSGTDCGGCFVKRDTYMVVDKASREITRKSLSIIHSAHRTNALFEKGNGAYVLSPDKTKVAYIDTDFDGLEPFGGRQSIYVYDFRTESVEKFRDLGDERIAELGPGGFFLNSKNKLYWDGETGELILK